jgi:hypothetical protein
MCSHPVVVMEPSSKQEWWKSSANISAIKDYAIQQGLLVKATRDPSDETVTNVSVTLTPSLFPRELFDLACSIAADLNSLVDRVSRDEQFLEDSLQRYLPWVFELLCHHDGPQCMMIMITVLYTYICTIPAMGCHNDFMDHHTGEGLYFYQQLWEAILLKFSI